MLVLENGVHSLRLGKSDVEVSLSVPRLPGVVGLPLGFALLLLLLLRCERASV